MQDRDAEMAGPSTASTKPAHSTLDWVLAILLYAGCFGAAVLLELFRIAWTEPDRDLDWAVVFTLMGSLALGIVGFMNLSSGDAKWLARLSVAFVLAPYAVVAAVPVAFYTNSSAILIIVTVLTATVGVIAIAALVSLARAGGPANR